MLRYLKSAGFCILGVSLGADESIDFPMEDVLVAFREVGIELLRLIESPHLPAFEKFYLNIEMDADFIRPWIPHLKDCFPELIARGCVEIMPAYLGSVLLLEGL